MNQDLRAKEEELLRINQEIEQKRKELKQQQKDIDLKIDVEQLVQRITQEQKSKPISKEVEDVNLEEQMQRLKEYEDKTKEINELEMIQGEEKNICKIQALKLQSLISQTDDLTSSLRMKESMLQEMQLKGQSFQDQSNKFYAQITQLNDKIDQTKQKQTDIVQKKTTLAKQNQIINKELEGLKKECRQLDRENNKKDLMIARKQEEIGNIRATFKSAKLSLKEKYGDQDQNNENLRKVNQKLEAQIIELLNTVKKQIKLQDIMKRQRIHLIAAKMFQFIETDFTNTLQLGERLKNQ